ncbi:MAG TPA: SDR family NAD(P)-dependent oxidoreductase [Solirubrobacterales bacterium]|jgi:NAD(P)-dependent dehydrogenase (short-subunit alcohol dehydrogenase family)|nr:SDR family NAD(P)-dependent oxidoreductase [Solirubrobacterales bacterium]
MSTRTALVTGAGGGIGRAVCLALAEQGWAVAACDLGAGALETAELVRDAGGEALGLTWDVRDGIAAKQAHAEAERELGPVGAVVANAAIVDRVAPAEKISEEAWRNEIDVNLNGAFLSIQPALGPMRERGRGRIVAVSSTAATDGLAGQAAYAASKAGVLGMVRTLALELAPAGVTANAVLPGMVETEKVEAMPAEVRERALRAVPMKRFATPEEVAAVVAFLCSDAAAYVTGTWLPVDGGIGLSNLTLGRER